MGGEIENISFFKKVQTGNVQEKNKENFYK